MVTLSLEGKVALITGGSRGIGAETVRVFVEAGARVVFSYNRAEQPARELQAACGGESRCVALRHPLGNAAEGRSLVTEAIQAFGRLDALVVNHGVWAPDDVPIDRMTETQWDSTMGVNLDSVFGLVQAAVAHMRKHLSGHIVLISSTSGQRGEAFHADYSVTKGALISLTKSLSSELARDGIYVNCVAPGWVNTDMSASAINHPATREKILSTIPLGRVATAREIAGPVLFLCTPYAGFMSGEIVNVNGGAVLVG